VKILSIDIGTTYIKSAIVEYAEDSGFLRIVSSVDIPQQAIVNDIVYEHSPNYVLNELVKIIKHYVKIYKKIDAVSLSSYLFSLIFVNRGRGPLTNIITWVDRRAEKILPELLPYTKIIYERTGCPLLSIYNLPKILYFAKHHPEILSSSDLVLDIKSLVTLYLSGEPVTDYSSASGSYQLLNIYNLRWDDYILTLAGIDENKLPKLEEADYRLELKPSIAKEVGLDTTIPLILGLYDGGSMIFGLTGGREGVAVVNMGTSSMLRIVSRACVIDRSEYMFIQTYYLYRGSWVPGIAWNNCGIVFEHLVKIFKLKLEDIINYLYKIKPQDYLKSSLPITIPLLYPERLMKLSFESGISILGLKAQHTVEDIVASVIEGFILLLKYSDDILKNAGLDYDYVVGGGKILSIPLTQLLLASALNKELFVSEFIDATHLGNTLIALKALGILNSDGVVEISRKMLKTSVKPVNELKERLNFSYKIFKEYLTNIINYFKSS
jgi:gluconokinase